MDNLIFCLNATIPIFLTLMLGYFLRKINLYDDSFVAQMNKFVFKAALPALLFMNVAESDFIKVWDTKFVLFCFGRPLTAAARQSSALLSSRTFMEMPVWHLL